MEGSRNQMLSVLPSRKVGHTLEAPESTSVMVGTAKERPDGGRARGQESEIRAVQSGKAKIVGQNERKLN